MGVVVCAIGWQNGCTAMDWAVSTKDLAVQKVLIDWVMRFANKAKADIYD